MKELEDINAKVSTKWYFQRTRNICLNLYLFVVIRVKYKVTINIH